MLSPADLAKITDVVTRYTSAIQIAVSNGSNTDVSSYSIALTDEDVKKSMGKFEDYRGMVAQYPRYVIGDNLKSMRSQDQWGIDRYTPSGEVCVDQSTATRATMVLTPIDELPVVGSDNNFVYEIVIQGLWSAGHPVVFGAVIGFIEKPDGTIDYLSVLKTPSAVDGIHKLGLYKNAVRVAQSSGPDGEFTPALPVPIAFVDVGQADPNGPNGVWKILISLSGHTLDVQTTNGDGAYQSTAKLTYTFTDSAFDKSMLANRRLGYIFSGLGDLPELGQLGFSTATKRVTTVPIMDLKNFLVYKLVSNDWVVESGKVPGDYLKPSRQYLSIGTQKLIFIDRAMKPYWLR